MERIDWLALFTMLPLMALGWAWRGSPVRLSTWTLRIIPLVCLLVASVPASCRGLKIAIILSGCVALMLVAMQRCRQKGSFRGFWRSFDSMLYILLVAPAVYLASLFACAVLLFAVGLGVGVVMPHELPRLRPWRCSPVSDALPFSVHYRHTHAFLAEYDKRIEFKSGRKVPLWTDTGGAGPFEVYALDAGRYYIVDGLKSHNEFMRHDYLVDVSNETVSIKWKNSWFDIPPGEGVISSMGGSDDGDCSFGISGRFADYSSEKYVTVKGRPVGDTLKRRRLLGHIYPSGRFRPSQQKSSEM